MVCLEIKSKKKRGKEEDHRLANWRKWLSIRRRFHKHVYKIQKRLPVNLLINAAENRRSIIQDKLILEYAKIPIPDAIRGNPNFWSLPPASKKFPSLFYVLPKEKNYEIPTINYVGVPKIIKKEKGILYGKSKRKDLWIRSKYRKRQVKEFEDSIRRVLPHTPEIDGLIIIGKGAENNEPVNVPGTPILIDKETSTVPEVDDKRTALQVDEFIFDFKDQKQDLKKCYISIKYDCALNDKVQSKITLRNIGNITLRYYWQCVLPEKATLDIIPYRPPTCSFVFKKNESKILPGESKVLQIYFQTNRLGIHKETWELCTEPSVFSTGRLLLILWVNAELESRIAIENKIRDRIEEGMKNTIIADTLLDTLKMVRNLTKSEESILSEESLTAKDIFEASNAYFGQTGSLPFIYHYDKQLVQDLQDLYSRLKSFTDPHEWTYKIEDIQQLVENCDDLEEKNNCVDILSQTIDNLFKSKLIENIDEYKYTRMYNLLKITLDTMTERVYELRAMYKIPLIETFPIVDEEMYLKQEQEDIERKARTFPDIIETDAVSKIRKLKPTIVLTPSEQILQSKKQKNVKRKSNQKEKDGTINKDKKDNATGKEKIKAKKEEKSKTKGDKKGKRKSKGKNKSVVENTPAPIDLVPKNIVVVPNYMEENMQELCPCSTDMYEYNLHYIVHSFVCKIVSKVSNFLEYFETQKLVSQDILKNRIQLGIPVTQIDDRRKSLFLQKQQNWKDSAEISDTFSFTSESSIMSDSLSNLSNAYSSCFDLRVLRSCFDIRSEKQKKIQQIEEDLITDATQEQIPIFKPKCKCELQLLKQNN